MEQMMDGSRSQQERLISLGKSIDPAFLDSKRICGLTRKAAEGRLLGIYRISDLVIRKDNKGAMNLAAFISYMNMKQVDVDVMPRPSEWLEMDFISGTPKARHLCKDLEFSDAPHDELYSSELSDECDFSSEYYRAAYSLLDEVRIGFMQTGKIDADKYREYMAAIQANVPESYRRFFADLSQV